MEVMFVFWGGLSVTSSGGHDLLMVMEASSVSTPRSIRGIAIHASTLCILPVCGQAVKDPSSSRLAGYHARSTLCTLEFTAFVPDVR